jgi:DnaJ homolog subfamily C member 8
MEEQQTAALQTNESITDDNQTVSNGSEGVLENDQTLLPAVVSTDKGKQTNQEPTNEDDSNDNGDNENGDEDWTIQRDALKFEGDNSFRSKHYSTAIHYYTSALSLDPNNGTLLSNRSAAYLKANYKSKALHDALACVETKTMGNKGISRYAAALQSLHRHEDALQQWDCILQNDPQHTVAIIGRQTCQEQLELLNAKKKQQGKEDEEETDNNKELLRIDVETETNLDDKGNIDDPTTDDLDDFFNDVEEVTAAVHKEKLQHVRDNESSKNSVPTDAILSHKKELGTVYEQVERLILRPNYFWYNLNPFHVLDIPYTSSKVDISRRYKALSLLLHPDRYNNSSSSDDNNNQNTITKEQVQLAYDQVLNAKATLFDDDKLKHIHDLIEQGMNQGKADYQKQQQELKTKNKIDNNYISNTTNNNGDNGTMTLEEYQNRATYRIFATIEYTRQQVLEREKSFYQKEQESMDSISKKESNHRTYDTAWQQSDRVHNRIDDWRSFQQKKKQKKV